MSLRLILFVIHGNNFCKKMSCETKSVGDFDFIFLISVVRTFQECAIDSKRGM